MRFSCIPSTELLCTVRDTGLVSDTTILDAIKLQTLNPLTSNNRGLVLLDENVARPELGAKVLKGILPEYLLDGDFVNYSWTEG